MKQLYLYIGVAVLLVLPMALFAQLSGGAYEIYGDTFSFVSTGETSGGAFTLFSSGGEFFATTTGGGDYSLRAGFRAVEKGLLRATVTSSSLSLGTLTTSSVATATTTITIETDNFNGYTLALKGTTGLVSGSDEIDGVSDGSVTAGSEEYGVSATGDDVVSAGDVAVTTTASTISTGTGTITGNTTTLVFKVAVSSTTPVGSYSQTVQLLTTVTP